MEMNKRFDGDLLILDVSGDITFFNVSQVIAEIELAHSMQGVCRVALDTEDVQKIDSAAFGSLVSKALQLQGEQGYLRLVNPHPGIVNALHRIHIQELLPSYRSLEEAIGPR